MNIQTNTFKAYLFALLLLTLCYSLYGESVQITQPKTFTPDIAMASLPVDVDNAENSDALANNESTNNELQPVNAADEKDPSEATISDNTAPEKANAQASKDASTNEATVNNTKPAENNAHPLTVMPEEGLNEEDENTQEPQAPLLMQAPAAANPVVANNNPEDTTIKDFIAHQEKPEANNRLTRILSNQWKEYKTKLFIENSSFVQAIITEGESPAEVIDFNKRFTAQKEWLDTIMRTMQTLNDEAYQQFEKKNQELQELVNAQKVADAFLACEVSLLQMPQESLKKLRLMMLYDLYGVIKQPSLEKQQLLQDTALEDHAEKLVALYRTLTSASQQPEAKNITPQTTALSAQSTPATTNKPVDKHAAFETITVIEKFKEKPLSNNNQETTAPITPDINTNNSPEPVMQTPAITQPETPKIEQNAPAAQPEQPAQNTTQSSTAQANQPVAQTVNPAPEQKKDIKKKGKKNKTKDKNSKSSKESADKA